MLYKNPTILIGYYKKKEREDNKKSSSPKNKRKILKTKILI